VGRWFANGEFTLCVIIHETERTGNAVFIPATTLFLKLWAFLAPSYSELSREIAREVKVLLNPHDTKFSRTLHQNLSPGLASEGIIGILRFKTHTLYLVFTAVSLVSNINLQEGKWVLWNDAENSGFTLEKTVKWINREKRLNDRHWYNYATYMHSHITVGQGGALSSGAEHSGAQN
jgi:hypothetical protein